MTSKGEGRAAFTEVDEVNHPTATYIYSASHPQDPQQKGGRVDVMLPSAPTSSWSIASLKSLLVEVFLPTGYPHSVSDDYTSYQIFDSLQAFSSSIAGLLSSRAVLQGVGVGNANATPTNALLLHILQDTSGRIATILFAHRVGTALEPECKMYRLAADVFNDIAMILDCLSPMIPAGVSRVSVLSAAGVLRALCGVAGGSSKASLSAHFARWGNLAEVNAKDSSQETIISLIGMLVGSFVVSHVTSYPATWISLLLLQALHLSLNYAAVRSVQMTSLNRQRANIVFSTLLETDPDISTQPDETLSTSPQAKEQPPNVILTPAQVSTQEKIFQRDGLLTWTPFSPSTKLPRQGQGQEQEHTTLGTCRIGVSLHDFIRLCTPVSTAVNNSSRSTALQTPIPLSKLNTLFHEEDYILFLRRESPNSPKGSRITASILLKNGCTASSQLKAWLHALFAARILSQTRSSVSQAKPADSIGTTARSETEHVLEVVTSTLRVLNHHARMDRYLQVLTEVGWDITIAALETKSGRRVICED